MKIASIAVAVILGALGSVAHAATINVEVRDVASAKGKVLVALCDEATFLKRCLRSAVLDAKRGNVEASFPNVPPGRYAIMAYHDENADKRLNRSLIGIPTEGIAFSRNAVSRMGPPRFSDVAITVAQTDTKLTLDLTYN